MKLRLGLLALASMGLGVFLIAVVVRIGGANLHQVMQRLGSASPIAVFELIVLLSLQGALSSRKWLIVDRVLRRPDQEPLTLQAAFALTCISMPMGQVLPLPLSMVVVRSFGTYFTGKTLTRGTVGSVFEQGFDFLVVCILMLPSVLTRWLGGRAITWIVIASLTILATCSLAGIGLVFVRRCAELFSKHLPGRMSRVRNALTELERSGLLDASLARRLLLLSSLRFSVMVLAAGQTSAATGIVVQLWHVAAAMPFVGFSTLLATTPGGLGLNELTYTSTLHWFGVPVTVAAEWAVANRFLTAAASIAVGCVAVLAFLLIKAQSRFRRGKFAVFSSLW